MLRPLTEVATTPLSGGCVTRHHKALLPFGSFSDMKNLRGENPGFRKRPGQIKLHTSADGSNEVLSLYQFRKRRIDEEHFFVQFSDGGLLDATNAPPTVTTGVFGAEVFTGTGTGEVPAAYSVVDDILLYSNGVDQHQTYSGDDNYIDAFVLYNESTGAKTIPEEGLDFTSAAIDGLTTTSVPLDGFGPVALPNNVTAITKANPGVVSSTAHLLAVGDIVYFSGLTEMTELNGTFQTVTVLNGANTFSINNTSGYGFAEATGGACGFNACKAVFICLPLAATKLTFTISLPNGTASVAHLYYRKGDNSWATTSMTDGTISGGATLGKGGSMIWAAPPDEKPSYMYGQSGFWYMLRVTVALDGEVELTKVTFGSGFQDLTNVWNGVIPYVIEAMHYDNSADLYKTYGAAAVNIRLMEQESGAGNDDKDRLYFSSFDPIKGIYIDVGATPNTATTAVVYGINAWTGSGFAPVGTITDGTNGLTNSGWITWPELATAEPSQFKTTQYYAYWYYFWIGTAELSSSVDISIYTMPYFDIERLGKGLCNVAWKDMAAYAFTNYSNYIYITEPGMVTALNGQSYGILKAGDGRTNAVVAMRKFYNELLCFQEERGVEGGTITLFQGYSPSTFGKLLINSNIGTFSTKTVAVVDGIMTSTETEEAIKTMCFFLSRYGVCTTDGLSVSIISDDIQNYFDPTKSECIRRGYEDKMWLNHDSAFNVIRIGLVSGSSATLPNVFPVFDLITKTWSFDTPAQELSCMIEVEAATGDITVLQVGGGIDDGFVYLLNNSTDDVSTAIDSYFTMELNARGAYLQLSEMVLRAEAKGTTVDLDIPDTNTSSTTSADTSHVIDLPSNIAAGDMLLVIFTSDNTTCVVSDWDGFTEIFTKSRTDATLVVAVKKATGSEGATITITTSTSIASSHIGLRIVGALDPDVQAPEVSTGASGNSATPDPDVLAVGGGAQDYIWLAVAGWDNVKVPTSYPLPDNNIISTCAGTSSNTLVVCTDELSQASLNPDAYALAFGDDWVACTIAISPNGGDVDLTFTRNTLSAGSKTLTMKPEVTDQLIRRHRFMLNINDQNISIKVQNDQPGREMLLLDIGMKTFAHEER